MRISALLLAFPVSLLALSSEPARAQHSWGGLYPSVFLTTDYRYDGASFTGHKPTTQGSLYWAAPNSFYAGVWVSGVNFGDLGDTTTSYEVDTYGGRNFDFGKTRLSLEGMFSSFPDNETPGPTYDFVTLKARVLRSIDALSFGGSISYVPEASYGAGPAWRVTGETAYRWNAWLTTSANIGHRWSDSRRDRSFWDVGVKAKWNRASFDLRYSDTNQNFAECGFIDWCESGVTLTMQVDLWK
jgi:uncharacterized protein (TIGR02001 family)